MVDNSVPDGIPVLSAGKHHSPRRGACFMEMASVLAGEPWSDRPLCTHPLLAHLARMVNDYTSDAGRSRLAPYIPSVIGVRGGGLAWEVSFVAAVAARALPEAPESYQRPLAVGLLRCEALADTLGPGAVDGLDDLRRATADVPHATAWARRFSAGMPASAKQFHKRSAPHLLSCAVRGTKESAASDVDERLRQLLVAGIATARRLEPGQAATTEPAPTTEPRRRRRFAASLWR